MSILKEVFSNAVESSEDKTHGKTVDSQIKRVALDYDIDALMNGNKQANSLRSPTGIITQQLFKRLKKKEAAYKRFLMDATLNTIKESFQNYQKKLLETAAKFRIRAGEILDEIEDFKHRLPKARRAFEAWNLKRDGQGNYEDDDLMTVLIMIAETKGISPEILRNMNDQDLADFAAKNLPHAEKYLQYKSEEYQVVSKVAEVLEQHEKELGQKFKQIIENENLDDWDKKQQLNQLMEGANISEFVAEELAKLDVQNYQIIEEVLKSIADTQIERMILPISCALLPIVQNIN